MVITRTPYRISFFGGGTDYPEWYTENGGGVLACGINKYSRITLRYLPSSVRRRYRITCSQTEFCNRSSEISHPAARAVCERFFPDRGVEICHDGDLPACSGMGTSSSFAVGLLHAAHRLTGSRPERLQLAREAARLEREVLRETVGDQDQVLASYGGLNFVRFDPQGAVLVQPLNLTGERLQEFSSRLMLFFTGIVRNSSSVASHYVPDLVLKKELLSTYVPMAEEGYRILADPTVPLARFGELLHRAWQAKRSLSPGISSSWIDYHYELARNNGAQGGKLLGAGGGGFLLLVAEQEAQARIRVALESLLEVSFEIDPFGSQVVFSDQSDEEWEPAGATVSLSGLCAAAK